MRFKKYLGLLAILSLVACSAVPAATEQQSQSMPSSASSVASSASSPSAVSGSVLNPVGLKTYTNAAFHYSISYPSSWKVSGYADQTPSEVHMWRYRDPLDENEGYFESLTILSYFASTKTETGNQLYIPPYTNSVTTTLNGQLALQATQLSDSGAIYFFTKGDRKFALVLGNSAEDKEHVGAAMVRTFKILPQKSLIKDAGTELTSKDSEPIRFSTVDLPVKMIKKETIDMTKEYTQWMVDNAKDCGPKRPEGYFAKINTLFTGIKAIRYQILDFRGHSTYQIIVAPNKMQYADMKSFNEDFFSCGAGGNFPYKLSKDWLIFTNSCGGVSPDPCIDYKTFTEPTITIKGSNFLR